MGGQQNSPISSARALKKQHKGPAPCKIREEGGRRDDHFEAPSLVDVAPRYVEFNFENSQGGYLEPNEVVDLEPLRMVAMDGSEWGLASSGALVALEEGLVGAGQQVEEAVSVASEASGYEKWEDSCLVKFSEFLGFPTVGFESEIMGLLRKMVASSIKWKIRGLLQCPDVNGN